MQCARAAIELLPYGTVSVSHNSNVFARDPADPPYPQTGNTQFGDTLEKYLAGLTGRFSWGLETLQLTAEGSRYDFDHFTALDHYESRLLGVFNWQLGHVIDGSIDVAQTRTMAGLADTLSDQLEIQTDRTARATARMLLSPLWRIDVQPSWHSLDLPLESYPKFGYHESGVAAGINYLGISKLTFGLRGQFLDGSYHDIVGATRYHQFLSALTAEYAVSGLSSFEGNLGLTRRNSSLINPAEAGEAGGEGGQVGRTSDLTGSLAYRRALSVKTAVTLRVYRQVQSYAVGANPEVGTGVQAGIKWDPDVKFSLLLSYKLEKDLIEGDLQIANFVNRTDHLRGGQFEVRYAATRWLTLRPYVSYDNRTSNYQQANYSSTIIGLDVTAQLDKRL